MSEFLFIRPGTGDNTSYSWFVYDADGKNVLSTGENDSLAELVELNANSGERSVIALYPADRVVFKKVSFPGRLRKNPNLCLCMLEDELAQDPDDLEVHILNKKGNDYDVMICENGQIARFEEELKSAGLKIEKIIPDVMALPGLAKSSMAVGSLSDVWQKLMKLLNQRIGDKNTQKGDSSNTQEETINSKADIESKVAQGAKAEKESSDSSQEPIHKEDKDVAASSEKNVPADAKAENAGEDGMNSSNENESPAENGSLYGNVVALRLGDEWLFRTGAYQGFVIGVDWLESLYNEQEGLENVTALTPLPSSHPASWIEKLCTSVPEAIAEGALEQEYSLSKSYARKKLEMQFLYPWVKVAVAAVLLGILLVVNFKYTINTINQETQAYKQQQRIIFGKLTGSGPTASNPVYSMKQLLGEKSPIGTYDGFVDLGKKLSAVILAHPEIELVSLQYDQDRCQFVMRFLGDEGWDVRPFASTLKSDFMVSLTDSKPSRNQVLYTVHLRRIK